MRVEIADIFEVYALFGGLAAGNNGGFGYGELGYVKFPKSVEYPKILEETADYTIGDNPDLAWFKDAVDKTGVKFVMRTPVEGEIAIPDLTELAIHYLAFSQEHIKGAREYITHIFQSLTSPSTVGDYFDKFQGGSYSTMVEAYKSGDLEFTLAGEPYELEV